MNGAGSSAISDKYHVLKAKALIMSSVADGAASYDARPPSLRFTVKVSSSR
jgi:hypothetical protein